jgi:hypothetical protein
MPHRFGKTISVSMFAAAIMFACAGCEVSIYSTCKRISTKLLRNVTMFLGIIYDVLKCEHHRIIRANQEEVHLQGNEGYRDVRIIQSYPSKVEYCVCLCVCCLLSTVSPRAMILHAFAKFILLHHTHTLSIFAAAAAAARPFKPLRCRHPPETWPQPASSSRCWDP